MLIRNGRTGGRRVDVRLSNVIEAVGQLAPIEGERVLQAGGGEILPGLHDHHLHFMATAAALESVQCGPPLVRSRQDLEQALRATPGEGWVRGVGYHESVAGDIDRGGLDRVCGDRPVRLQHRSGKLWVLNSAALDLLAVAAERGLDGIERNASGEPTGRLFRMDRWLRDRLAESRGLDFAPLSRRLAGLGVTGFTDASFTNDQNTLVAFDAARRAGNLLQKCTLMGDASLATGHRKIMLDEDALPALDELVATIAEAHEAGRNVAFHCVSHVELLFALTALGELPRRAGDRIEHAAVVRDDMLEPLADAGVTVVTQPGFLLERGDQYLADLPAAEIPWLYRYRSLLDAGIPVIASSDAPYGPVSPFTVVAAAAERETAGGVVIGAAEQVAPEIALAGYCQDAGGAERSVVPGAPADLCVLTTGWDAARTDPARTTVASTIVDGNLVYSLTS